AHAASPPAPPVASGKVTTFKILSWQEIPSQIKAEDDAGNEVSLELAPKFAARIDMLAQKRGFTDSDAYLAQWKWSDEQQRPGTAQMVAQTVKTELESQANW